MKLRLAIGRFSTVLVGIGERALAALRLNRRRLGLHDTVSVTPPMSMVSAPSPRRSPGLTSTPVCFIVLKPLMLTWIV